MLGGGGGEEGASMLPNMQRFKLEMERRGGQMFVDFQLIFDPKGRHNEERWGQEFPKAIEWLYYKQTGAQEN
jgi:hypothetical protein